ncbi:hypothetical protein BDY19DRAFT_498398 [Irpex rosettiformis]|uniref:Uncharacterized protein n=1 Tax=Irpex rosettiformis TaxID=378272 RepID=A0ACB8UEG6_9APHY|nr:hypothetical protein BDY19DRAFT_498398 [Irpex rosettiformis]
MADTHTREPTRRASNTRPHNKRRPSQSTKPTSSSRDQRSSPSSRSVCCCCLLPFRMPSVFNIIRLSVYTAVLVWTVICLAIAAHFQSLLVSSDLTRFIPFAIFVCSASMLLMVGLLGFGFWRDRNPISTRVELGCLGLAGVLWLALGAFLGSTNSGDSDVECFSSANSQEPMTMPGFNTETFHAQYRVLEAFSIFNILLIWAFLLMLLYLAVRQHRWGNRAIWLESVTAFPWFGGKDAQTGKPPAALPDPVSAKRSNTTSTGKSSKSNKSQTQVNTYPVVSRDQGGGSRRENRDRERGEQRTDRQERNRPTGGLQEKRPSQHRRPSMRDAPTRNEVPTYVYWMPHQAPDVAYTLERDNSNNTRQPRSTERYYDRERDRERVRGSSPRR